VSDVYYVTEGGDYYHADPDCTGIKRGHSAARTMKYNKHPLVPVPLAEARKRALRGQPCRSCVSSDSSEDRAPDSAGLRERFPGYFPPGDDDVQDFMERGVVAFDTNALLDIYRFNDHARTEYIAALRQLSERLWIPHRVGEELLENRLSVINECSTATDTFAKDLNSAFESVVQVTRNFGNRRHLSEHQKSKLEKLLTDAEEEVIRQARAAYNFDLEVDSSIKSDPILFALEAVLEGKVGPPLEDQKAAEMDAIQRLEAEIPPGYKDWKKDRKRAIGDCLIWLQLIREATHRRLPITLVCNEQKPDWEAYSKASA
jgi:hypothetical protein